MFELASLETFTLSLPKDAPPETLMPSDVMDTFSPLASKISKPLSDNENELPSAEISKPSDEKMLLAKLKILSKSFSISKPLEF